ncbi:flavin-dependent oxidoreductase, F420-dependent methylene-tetrahydromethanopterin reductase [Rhizobium leguminosarum bv. trifolii WSM597]|uniref:Flavin-dependent oxidoreductase, F420-dependent methylene-tetrahydromethanopterin reductase n=1 Tax=Rhizobium leguminosarum bv. trifolii WSM597 TaxID=754764 RepID=J0H851_RHILT|nr:LLM class flavin-dependent oxidoreductase [Rhizobium leguminosarum]EJB06443.1 flavin-dependent oxidoreductase, F420-dependent methylene-tetrahydromethanopterin reductase [Rhizobium leguminosarum bv. trifolii WSM597]
MYLGFSLTPFGHHPAAWRGAAEIANLGFEALLSQVARAEQAGLDFVLLSDRLGARPVDDLSPVATPFEPTTLVAALATRARRIGFLAAAATHQHEPYNLARRFASLESISNGRTGWVAVTTGNGEDRDREYVDLVGALWDSWEDDAFIYDKEKGRFFQPDKMHVLNHKGEHFSVRGPLNVSRSPQGKPVLAQVLTDENRALAAHAAELVFLQSSSPTGAEEAAFDFIRSLEAADRRRDARILANLVPFIAATQTEAQALHDALQAVEDISKQPLSGAILIGTPIAIVDSLQQWLEAGQIDGFAILPPTLEIADLFLAEVAPELQRRGLIGRTKAGSTLRDYLNLPRPAHPAATWERAS